MRPRTGSGRRAAGWAAAVCLVLLASACAQRAGGATGAPNSPSPAPPADPDALVLRIQRVGGFLPIGVTEASLPVVSIYADGRVITEGPVPAIYPGPALPNIQVQRISTDAVRALVDRALAAGVRDTADLGRPGVADAATTRITVITDSGTYVREVYALGEAGGTTRTGGGKGPPATPTVYPNLTAEQQAARDKLLDLVRALTDLEGTLGAGAVGDSQPYPPTAVAAVVTAWHPRASDPPQPPRAWPGPALPGEQLGGQAGLTCVSAGGQPAQALLDAARQADALTPWTSADGTPWSVTFRPLLPDESGCADLAS
jgi:hypothetical protein